MLRNRSFQVKMVKDAIESPAPENRTYTLDLSQMTSEENRRAFVLLFGAYASVKLLNTACKIALVTASK